MVGKMSKKPAYVSQRTLYLGIILGALTGALAHQAILSSGSAAANVGTAKKQIQDHYIAELGNPQLEQAAIQGMILSLDDYSELLSPEDYQALLASSQGTFAGIGVEIERRAGNFTVTRVMSKSPAAESRLQIGDRISRVDGKVVDDWSLSELIRHIRGPEDSEVQLGLLRRQPQDAGNAARSEMTVTLTRANISNAFIEKRLLKNDLGYIGTSNCYDGLAEDIENAVRAMGRPTLRGLILDLRGNPGGTLNCAVATTNLFLNEGVVVSTQNNRKLTAHGRRDYRATKEAPFLDLPLAVLVDGSTASAAEIIAGALQDRNRATIVGSPTFAKGTVQTLLSPLPNGSALKITTAHYLTPLGRSFDGVGLVPDVVLSNADDAAILAAAAAALSQPR